MNDRQVLHINGIPSDNRPDNLHLCRDEAHRHRIEASFTRLLAPLLASGVVVYDRVAEEYRLA